MPLQDTNKNWSLTVKQEHEQVLTHAKLVLYGLGRMYINKCIAHLRLSLLLLAWISHVLTAQRQPCWQHVRGLHSQLHAMQSLLYTLRS